MGGTHFFFAEGGGGFDDVDDEMDISEANFLVSEANFLVGEANIFVSKASKLSAGARIFRGLKF